MKARTDWLDRLALRSCEAALGGAEAAAPPAESALEETEGFSRATALKLGAVGAASLSLGLWKAPLSSAYSAEECLQDCNEGYDLLLRKGVDACESVILGLDGSESAWTRALTHLLAARSWRAAEFQYCKTKARLNAELKRQQCISFCADCERKKRSLPSAKQARQGQCRPPKADKPQAPIPPPPPAGSFDACLNCKQAGGECCGVGTEPGSICACASPDITVPDKCCKRYGCCG